MVCRSGGIGRDTSDLKSDDLFGRAGSSPASGTLRGCPFETPSLCEKWINQSIQDDP